MDEMIEEFVAETREMLAALGGELISWEEDPSDRPRLDSIFRFVHTVKGNCGFFDFPRLQALSHAAEDALSDVRAGRRQADAALVSAVLAVIDRIGDMVDAIEAGEEFPEGGDEPLTEALEHRPESARTSAPLPANDTGPETGNAEQRAPARVAQPQRSIRLPVELLDKVMSGVSDMVLARNELARRIRETDVEPIVHEPFERLSGIIAEVRDSMTRTRMQRVEVLFSGLPRLVRDLSAELGRQIQVDVSGSEVEIDREMIEIIRDPLTHIIRNAVDHGIEPPEERRRAGKPESGTLSVTARQSGNKILIDVVDDGHGVNEARLVEKALAAGIIDPAQAARMSQRERMDLMFEPGLSTAEKVTAISGRGVGMDVVRANIERIGGRIHIDSNLGDGTRITLQVPLTLTIIPALTIGAGGQQFAIPRTSVEEIIHVEEGNLELSEVGGTLLARVRNRRIPCFVLSDLLKLESNVSNANRPIIILRLTRGDLFALMVDELHGHGELVVKPAAPAIMSSKIYAGTTLTDDGYPILLLEVGGLARAGGVMSNTLNQRITAVEEDVVIAPDRIARVLVFTALDGRRKAMPLTLLDRLEEVRPEAVQNEEGRLMVMIGRSILPLAGVDGATLPDSALRLLRLVDGSNAIAYAVEEAHDIREIDAALLSAGGPEVDEAIVLIDDQPTPLISSYRLFARHARTPAFANPPRCRLPADDPWIQNFVRPIVEAAGYLVMDTDAEGEADEVDLAILTEPRDDAPMRAREVIRLRAEPDETEDTASIYRYDQAALMGVLRRNAGGA